MTNVVFCSYDKPGSVGGPFSWLRRLLPALRDRGIDCRGLFLTHFGGTGPVIEGLREDGFECTVVDCHDRTADQTRWILEHLRENPPDVFVPNLVVAAYHASHHVKAAGIPTLGILHSDDNYYRAIQDEFIFGPSQRSVSGIVCVSRHLEEQVRNRNPFEVKVNRIPYGVAVPDAAVQHKTDRFRVAYVGRLSEEQKQISKLTRALIRVCRRVPNAQAIIYGDGPDRGNVEAILANEGQGVAVRLAGPVPNGQIQSELLQTDVLALLSDYEGLPIALLEAMACGCVPICLEMRSGIPELVRNEVEGLVVVDRESAFDEAIVRLHADVELRRGLARTARQRIVDEYSDTASFDEWADLLRSLGQRTSTTKIRVPGRIKLPPRNPALESAAQRMAPPSSMLIAAKRLRIMAGRLRRRFF